MPNNDKDNSYRWTADQDHSVVLQAEVVVSWSDAEVLRSATDQVAAMIYADIKPQIQAAIAAALDDQVNSVLVAVMDTEIQKTDKWGAKIGEPTTVRQQLMRETEAWLTDTVDSKGRTGSSTFGDKMKRIHWLVQEALNTPENGPVTALHRMIVAAIKATVGDVQELVNQQVREQVANQLRKK